MALLWASRAASRLRISAFHRRYFAPVPVTDTPITMDEHEYKEKLRNRLNSIPANKKCVVKTFKHRMEFEKSKWMVGTNIYLVDEDDIAENEISVGEDEGDTAGERWVKEFAFGKSTDTRQYVGGFRYVVDNETGFVVATDHFMHIEEPPKNEEQKQ